MVIKRKPYNNWLNPSFIEKDKNLRLKVALIPDINTMPFLFNLSELLNKSQEIFEFMVVLNM